MLLSPDLVFLTVASVVVVLFFAHRHPVGHDTR